MGIKLNGARRPRKAAPATACARAAAGPAQPRGPHPSALAAQNRELLRTQRELATAQERCRDLYDRAPVGYLTLDSHGRILEANPTAARLLAHPCPSLRRRPLSAFMAQADADRWHRHIEHALQQAAPWRIELRLHRADGETFEGQFDGLLVTHDHGPPRLRVTLTDVTLHRHADADRRAARQVVAAQEADRHRVARELHDDLGQRLSALKMQLAARASGAAPDPELASIAAAIDDAVASVRRMAGDLRPLMLDDLGLAAAVEALARRSARRYGLALRLRLTAADPPPGDPAAVTLYRLLQASLAVLAGQPGLGSLRVDLRDEAGARLLALQGRRRPTVPEALPAPGPERWTPLRETAHLLGCTLVVAALRRGGERVCLRMPLQLAEAGYDALGSVRG